MDIVCIARMIAGARGKAGSNLNYLNNTLDHLEELGLRDENLRACRQLFDHLAIVKHVE